MAAAYIFDIDGTLADCRHRLHHVTGTGRGKNWDAFFAGMGEDSPVAQIVALAQILSDADHKIVLCTGRPEAYRSVTEGWLHTHGVPFTALYMRPDNDLRADHIVKAQILDGIIADGYEPQLVIDDRPSVVAMWRERGLICLQCRDAVEFRGRPGGKLTLMVGPSGAGKTTWLSESGLLPESIVSSDVFRQHICGNILDQTKNDEVFAAVHDVTRTRLKHGLPVIVDATNLRRKDRLAVVALAPPATPVCYVVVNRPMEEKYRDAGWRATLPFDLIAKHEQTFKSQLADILKGDNLPTIQVIDARRAA